jgi:hypothetical protein
MALFGYLKFKSEKKLEFAWQHFGTQSSLVVKIILIQWLNEENWI